MPPGEKDGPISVEVEASGKHDVVGKPTGSGAVPCGIGGSGHGDIPGDSKNNSSVVTGLADHVKNHVKNVPDGPSKDAVLPVAVYGTGGKDAPASGYSSGGPGANSAVEPSGDNRGGPPKDVNHAVPVLLM